MVGNAVFVDTNVLVFTNQETAPFHRSCLETINRFRDGAVPLWISRQVIREYAAVMSRPQTFSLPLAPEVIASRIEDFLEMFEIADDTAGVTGHLVHLVRAGAAGGKQVHDANIVATMLAYDIPRLLTHNTADFLRFQDVIEILPIV